MEPDGVNSPSPSSASDDPEEKIVKPSNKCEECGKVFMTKALLKRHLQSHTGEKPHVCKICGNQYTQSWSLKTHMAKHTGDMGKQKPTGEYCYYFSIYCGKTVMSVGIKQIPAFQETNRFAQLVLMKRYLSEQRLLRIT